MEPETKTETNKLSMPMAIIVAGILIAGAIYFLHLHPKMSQKTIMEQGQLP